VFSWAGACYRYIGPLGLNQLGTYVPHKPQRGDISVTRHRRASVSKAPEGRHIGSKTSVQCFVYARSAAPPGPTCFLGRGLATNRLARWATIRWAHTCRTSPVTRGRRPLQGQRVFLGGACYQYIGPLGHNPLGTYLPEKPRNARSSAPTGPTCFLGRRPATNILARWATIRWAHTCRTSPVTRGRGLATNILARWATIPSAHTCRTSPVTRGRRPLQGQRVFLGRRLATNRLARWATNRSAHACR
jgi:hypothetical protein